MSARLCKACGTPNAVGASDCAVCGFTLAEAPLVDSVAPVAPRSTPAPEVDPGSPESIPAVPTVRPAPAAPVSRPETADGTPSRRVLALGAGALAILAVGIAIALATSTGGSSTPSDTRGSIVAESPADDSSDGPELTPASDSLLDVSEAQMESDIETLIREHHQAIVDGDWSTAWSLLSTRKQNKYEREEGYSGWVRAQKTLKPYLDPASAKVHIVGLDSNTGVATIRVRGMGWSAPGANCTTWHGVTWVKSEDDQWKYDPGYSTTPTRERKWKPRYHDLLGGSC